MNDKQLSKLAIVALAVLVVAVVVSKLTHKVQQPSLYGATLIQGLNPDIIGKIVLGPDDNPATLLRQDSHFVAVQRGDYPVANQALNNLIVSCQDATIVQKVTDDSQNHIELGVTQDQARSIVRFYDNDDKLIVGLLVGNRAEANRGTYVRRFDSDSVYLSGDLERLPTAVTEYFNKELFRVDTNAINRVEVALPDGFYTVVDDESGTTTLENLPANTTAKPTETRAVYEALTRVDFADVLVDQEILDVLEFNYAYACRLNNGVTYTAQLAQRDGAFYVRANARFSAADVDMSAQEGDEENQAIIQARQSVRDFNQRHDNWVYRLEQWQAAKMTKTISQLTQPVETQ